MDGKQAKNLTAAKITTTHNDNVKYVAVTNIPQSFRTSDLRSHFSSLVESKSFACFHYRHRPEKGKDDNSGENVTDKVEKKCSCIVQVYSGRVAELLRHNDEHWTDADGEVLGERCEVSIINVRTVAASSSTSGSNQQTELVGEDMLLQMPELRPPELMPHGNVGTPTVIFLDLIQHCLLPQSLINKLKLEFPKTRSKRLYDNVNYQYKDTKNVNVFRTPETSNIVTSGKRLRVSPTFQRRHHDKHSVKKAKESQPLTKKNKPLKDLPAPSASNDNVSSNESSDSSDDTNCDRLKVAESPAEKNVQQCLSSSSLCDDRHANVSKRKETNQQNPVRDQTQFDNGNLPTSSNEQINSEKPVKALSSKEQKALRKADRKRTRELMAEGIEERLIAVEKKYHNDEDAEEWDRHEAVEDDPSNQERNKERLYEEELEQVWEKGGPGVVFYTDAVYWQQQEGDFDEQTTDDLDVDFSPYEEPGTGSGDMDIKDFLKIRQERRFRSGYDSTDRFSIGIGKRIKPKPPSDNTNIAAAGTSQSEAPRIGAFEQFSKGIGRKVMERQGWKEGQGLGKSRPGITEALKGTGQKPKNKQGLGYTEAELPHYGPYALKSKKRPKHHLITTVYDNPKEADPKEQLLCRSEPTTLKHRQSHVELFDKIKDS